MDRKSEKLQIEDLLITPRCTLEDFMSALEKPPLECHHISTKSQLRELADNFRDGNLIDSQNFCREVAEY